MAKNPKIVKPSRNERERNLDIPAYLNRIVPPWGQTTGLYSADVWRQVVNSQPIALVVRDTLIWLVAGLSWKVEPRDSNQRDELKKEIDYYTKFFEYTGEYEYAEIVEWILKDALDLPFGGAVEVGRKYDAPDGKVMWIEPLDAGTLYPTQNIKYPVMQYVPQANVEPIYFPSHAVNRIYMNPRTVLREKGWGIAPPERIYMALQALNRGDVYYANLLLDTPEAGILDLGDMDAESAKEWVKAWHNLLAGIDPYKVPVIYEHEKPISYIPFTRSPTDLNFAAAMVKYASILCAGYGMSLSDIGLSTSGSGGETLAGTIRDERRTRRTGINVIKKKLEAFFNRLLPDYLRFRLVDLDDELMVSLGRARLATATSLNALIGKTLTEEEARQQLIADGLITISIPEALPQELKERQQMALNGGFQQGPQKPNDPNKKPPERPNMLGRPVSPGQGGWGEVAAKSLAGCLSIPFLMRSVYGLSENIKAVSVLKSETGLQEAASILQTQILEHAIKASPQIASARSMSLHQEMFYELRKEIDALYIRGEISDPGGVPNNAFDISKVEAYVTNLVNRSLGDFSYALAYDLVELMSEMSRYEDFHPDNIMDKTLEISEMLSKAIESVLSNIDTIDFDDIIN